MPPHLLKILDPPLIQGDDIPPIPPPPPPKKATHVNVIIFDETTPFGLHKLLESMCPMAFWRLREKLPSHVRIPPLVLPESVQKLSGDCSHRHYLSDNLRDKKLGGFKSGEFAAHSVSHLLMSRSKSLLEPLQSVIGGVRCCSIFHWSSL